MRSPRLLPSPLLLATLVGLVAVAPPAAAIHGGCDEGTFVDSAGSVLTSRRGRDYGNAWETLFPAPPSDVSVRQSFLCRLLDRTANFFITYLLRPVEDQDLGGSTHADSACGSLGIFENGRLVTLVPAKFEIGEGTRLECAYDPQTALLFNGRTYLFQVSLFQTYAWERGEALAPYESKIPFEAWINPRSPQASFLDRTVVEQPVCWEPTPLSLSC